MQKIATPQDLQAALRHLIAMTQGPERPSREKLAEELRGLADRVATPEGSPEKLVELFDSLRPKQKIAVALKSVMGTSEMTDGKPHDWLVGRRATQKRYNSQTITLMPVDGSWKPNKYNAFKIWKRTRPDGSVSISASRGDMGLTLVSINGISAR